MPPLLFWLIWGFFLFFWCPFKSNFRASGSVRRHCPLPFLLLPLSLSPPMCSVVLSPSLCSPSSPSPQASLSSISPPLSLSLSLSSPSSLSLSTPLIASSFPSHVPSFRFMSRHCLSFPRYVPFISCQFHLHVPVIFSVFRLHFRFVSHSLPAISLHVPSRLLISSLLSVISLRFPCIPPASLLHFPHLIC